MEHKFNSSIWASLYTLGSLWPSSLFYFVSQEAGLDRLECVAEIFYVQRTESEFRSVLWMFENHTLVVQTTKMAWLGKIVCSPPTCQFYIFVTNLIVCTYHECISALSVHLCFSKLASFVTPD